MTNFSREQQRYIDEAGNRSILIARPGSGKTRVGVQRFLQRAEKSPTGIAYLSFTNVAVEEAEKRASEAGKQSLLNAPNTVQTLDAFIRTRVFDPFAPAYFGKVIENIQIIQELGGFHRSLDTEARYKIFGLESYGIGAWTLKPTVRNGKSQFVRVLEHGVTLDVPSNFNKEIMAAKRSYLLDGYATYDDIKMWSLVILKATGLRSASIIATRFGEIIVDEAQDTSTIHQEILSRLEASGSSVSYIGDPKQGIFEFSDASGAFLEEMAGERERWDLTMNFRSTDKIVEIVKQHFGDPDMRASRICRHEFRGSYVYVGGAQDAIAEFERALIRANLSREDAAVIVRSRDQLREIRGEAGVRKFSPAIKRILLAWQRERNGQYKEAANDTRNFLRAVIASGPEPQSNQPYWRSLAWRFLREFFPRPGRTGFSEWIDLLRESVATFAKVNGLVCREKLGTLLKKAGLPEVSMDEFFASPPLALRTETVHGVKGESLGAVLLVGTKAHHEDWLEMRKDEMTAIGYVAFTRAKELLVLCCPTEEIGAKWIARGFQPLKT